MIVTIGEPCDCETIPRNYWRKIDGEWVEREIEKDAGERDAAEFVADDYIAWIIACPECQQVFAAGLSEQYTPPPDEFVTISLN